MTKHHESFGPTMNQNQTQKTHTDSCTATHTNPLCHCNTTNTQRANQLKTFIDTYHNEFGKFPKLMPLSPDGKKPIIEGKCSLNSDQAYNHLITVDEALYRIQHGARGFCIYAGKPSHNTENVVFIDHDDTDKFPAPTTTPTLQVLSGSGRGPHETYRNNGTVQNAVGKGRLAGAGEIRAKNQYVVTPGSIHPNGGIYHIQHNRLIATLTSNDLPQELLPGTTSSRRQKKNWTPVKTSDPRSIDDIDLEAALKKDDTLNNLWHGNYSAASHSDRSDAEWHLVARLTWWFGRNPGLIEKLMDMSAAPKWHNRGTNYRNGTLNAIHEVEETRLEGSTSPPTAKPESEEKLRKTDAPAPPVEIDITQRRRDIQQLVPTAIKKPGHRLITDPQGVGKTHSVSLNDANYALLAPHHTKALELYRNPDLHFNDNPLLRGRGQPRDMTCFAAKHSNDPAPCQHRDDTPDGEATCPSMCPVYTDMNIGSLEKAGFDISSHICKNDVCGYRDSCAWKKQFDNVNETSPVLGVHPYLTHRTLQGKKDLFVVDEDPAGSLKSSQRVSARDIQHIANVLFELGAHPDLAQYAEDVAQALFTMDTSDGATDTELTTLTPPDLSNWHIDNTKKEVDSEAAALHYLCEAKRMLWKHFHNQIQNGEWRNEKNCINPLIATLTHHTNGPKETTVKKAIAFDPSLHTCPKCSANAMHTEEKLSLCKSCGWDEYLDPYTSTEHGRYAIHIGTNKDNDPILLYRELPLPSAFPTNIIGLEAHASSDNWRTIFPDPDDVVLHGHTGHTALNATVVQITTGQYHLSTLKKSKYARQKIQAAVDAAAKRHSKLLIIGRKAVPNLFDLPRNTAFKHYGALVGENLQHYDAAMLIGAPHPNIPALARDVELLTGQRDVDTEPQMEWRPYVYTDADGDGRMIQTKSFNGVLGALFHHAREKEMEQAIHRLRPITADDTKQLYIMSNVPLPNTPVDLLLEPEAISDPARYVLGLDATDSLIVQAVAERNEAYISDVAEEVDRSVSTVWRRCRALVSDGVLQRSDTYQYHKGYRYEVGEDAWRVVQFLTQSSSSGSFSGSLLTKFSNASEKVKSMWDGVARRFGAGCNKVSSVLRVLDGWGCRAVASPDSGKQTILTWFLTDLAGSDPPCS